MNLRFLEAFYWVASLGSATRAAEKLSLTQAAVSSRILALEEELGVALFDRRDRRLHLSVDGQRLLVHALRLLDLQRDIRRDLGVEDQGPPVLRIGAIESIAHTWLVELLGRLRERYPQTRLELTVETSQLLDEHLRRGLIDLAILAMSVNGDSLRHRVLPPLPMVFASRRPPGQRVGWVRRRPADLALEQILTFQRGSQPHSATIDLFREHGAAVPHLHNVSSVSAMLRLVERGFGVATLPRAVVEPLVRSGALSIVRTEADLAALPLFVSWRPDPAADTLERVVAEVTAMAGQHAAQRQAPARPRARRAAAGASRKIIKKIDGRSP